MKIVYAALDLGDYYRFKIDDEIQEAIIDAKQWIKKCPYDGDLLLYHFVYSYKMRTEFTCAIHVCKDTTWISIFNENLLERGDNLLTLPSIYLTRRFRLFVDDAIKYLEADDIQLISIWKENK